MNESRRIDPRDALARVLGGTATQAGNLQRRYFDVPPQPQFPPPAHKALGSPGELGPPRLPAANSMARLQQAAIVVPPPSPPLQARSFRTRRLLLISGTFFTTAALGTATWAVNEPLVHPDWQWTGAAMFCALFLWLGVGSIAALTGSYVRIEPNHMQLRMFSWYRFRTVTIVPGSGTEVVYRWYWYGLAKAEILDIRSAGTRRPLSFALGIYKKADRRVIVRLAKEIARTR